VLQVKRVALRRGDDILPGDVMVAALSLRVNQLNEISIQNYSLTSAGVRELVSAIKARARAVSWGCARWIGGGQLAVGPGLSNIGCSVMFNACNFV